MGGPTARPGGIGMTMNSMTGFARSDGADAEAAWHWEVRSVNGRGLDVRLRLPAGFEGLEAGVRAAAARRFSRGNFQLNLTVRRSTGTGALRINHDLLDQVLAAMEEVSERLQLAPPRAEGVLALKGVLELSEPEIDNAADEARNAAILTSCAEALDGLAAMRRAEGAKLQDVLASQVDEIEALTNDAASVPALQPEAIRERLKSQVARLLDAGAELDETRLYQEAVLLATKGDIREELDRLHAHVAAARKLLGQDGAVGRKFDFLTQEFNREANTLCSKSSDAGLTSIGLKLKAVIDQMREQVQNIE